MKHIKTFEDFINESMSKSQERKWKSDEKKWFRFLRNSGKEPANDPKAFVVDAYNQGFPKEAIVAALQDHGHNKDDAETYFYNMVGQYESVNEGTTPTFKKLIKKAKAIGIETVGELEDLLYDDEFANASPHISGADFEIAKKHLKLRESVNEAYTKQSAIKAMGKSHDAILTTKSGDEYIIYNPDSGNDDNTATWKKDGVEGFPEGGGEGDEKLIKYSDIKSIKESVNEGSYEDFITYHGREIKSLITKIQKISKRFDDDKISEENMQKAYEDIENIYDREVVGIIDDIMSGSRGTDVRSIAQTAISMQDRTGTEMRQVVNGMEDFVNSRFLR